jgi:hypothetical protein
MRSFLVILTALALAPHPTGAVSPRQPVLVELFTSEGCSSCPPADALLDSLDHAQPVSGAETVVLSEHVDYWNSLGWSDPYSSILYSNRQMAYALRFGIESVYTPQMVVDGRLQFSGTDRRGVTSGIAQSAQREKVPVRIVSIVNHAPDTLLVRIQTDPAPDAELLLALADDADTSHVQRGENGGRTLRHVSVVRELTRVATLRKDRPFDSELKVHIQKNWHVEGMRLIAIVQTRDAGPVLGAAMRRLGSNF